MKWLSVSRRCRDGLFHVKPQNVLLLPGWQNSDPDHWQSRWEALYGYRRVDQHDWMTPRRGDWIAQIEDVILACDGPVVLVAHSLGCILTAAWAELSRSTSLVQGALLVAPGDPEREELSLQLPGGWAPIARQRLPFPAVLVASRNDPYCDFTKAMGLAESWGASAVDLGERGHINTDSGVGDWPEGHSLLIELIATKD